MKGSAVSGSSIYKAQLELQCAAMHRSLDKKSLISVVPCSYHFVCKISCRKDVKLTSLAESEQYLINHLAAIYQYGQS